LDATVPPGVAEPQLATKRTDTARANVNTERFINIARFIKIAPPLVDEHC
jgi:hypothetical protein